MNSERPHDNPIDLTGAIALLEETHANPTLLGVSQVARVLPSLRKILTRVPLRLGVLPSFTFEPLAASLELQALRAGLGVDLYCGDYGRAEQEMIDPASGLSAFGADAVLVAVRLADVCPTIYENVLALSPDGARMLLDNWFKRLASAIESFRSRSQAYVLVQNYDVPACAPLGIAEADAAFSQSALVSQANTRLREVAQNIPNVYVMDYDALVARHGRATWSDPRTELFGRIPVAPEHYWHLAGFYVRHLRPLFGLSRKVLALDADNTLWGGIVGDAGIDGIALGHDFPGNAFVALQKRILDLYHRGVVLAIVSKNEPGTVEAVLDKHPDMVLRPEHIAAMQVNWQPKPENIRRIAADLNLGLDSFVFIDDSPVECELMRAALPEVMTVRLPKDPAEYPGVIERLDCFDQWVVSEEDRRRGSLYKADVGRKSLRGETIDMPTFYRRLEMVATVHVDEASHVSRASQMTNRTNQFNMHTVRCSEGDIRRFVEDDDRHLATLALSDKFGDSGVVGLAAVLLREDEWALHLLLMSCRVLGRTVEQTFIRWLAQQATGAGAQRLVGLFAPTAKNKPFAGFFGDCGFVQEQPQGDVQRWVWNLDKADTTQPDWIDIREATRRGS